MKFILASRSPRRRELLGFVVPGSRIVVLPPRDPTEEGFEGLDDTPAIEERLLDIARTKFADVMQQIAETGIGGGESARTVVIAADTTIVAASDEGALHVIGQPPADDSWKETVRTWFRTRFAGRTHVALSALRVGMPGGKTVERIVKTEVEFIADVERHLNWYIETGEPRGKAGGYAIQGAGSIFASRVSGSLSNVIGLPLEALLDCFGELQIHAGGND